MAGSEFEHRGGRAAAGAGRRGRAGAFSERKARVIAGVRRIGLQAVWLVGGPVPDELDGLACKDFDFATTGCTYKQLQRLCARHGRAKPLEVAGQLVGVRLYAPWTPTDGIEIALARTEVSTGPGHDDFEIRPFSSQQISALRPKGHTDAQVYRALLERDLRGRDFTVNQRADGHDPRLRSTIQAGVFRQRRRQARAPDSNPGREE